MKADEVKEIDKEFKKTVSNSSTQINNTLKEFEKAVREDSKAVVVRPLAEAAFLFDRKNNLHLTFHQRLRSGGIHFDGGRYDVHRQSVDAKLFPNYFETITFASLTLDGNGCSSTFGQCHLMLKTSMIEHRASVFIGNSFDIITDLNLKPDKAVPVGYRATWNNRGKLATVKKSSDFSDITNNNDFSTLLNDGSNDFVEVHVCGSISQRTFEKVVVSKSNLDEIDRHLAKALKMKLESWGKNYSDWDTQYLEV
ncbi:MAG: hypothetical protein ABW092_04020 [Candidatus Thiodiazotropha sp.]